MSRKHEKKGGVSRRGDSLVKVPAEKNGEKKGKKKARHRSAQGEGSTQHQDGID